MASKNTGTIHSSPSRDEDHHDQHSSINPEEHASIAAAAGPWTRSSYTSTLFINTLAFILPALYSTPSKLWVANRYQVSDCMTVSIL